MVCLKKGGQGNVLEQDEQMGELEEMRPDKWHKLFLQAHMDYYMDVSFYSEWDREVMES